MQRAGPAEGHQRERARVDAALDGHHAQRREHLGLRHAEDALRAGDLLQPELAPQGVRWRAARRPRPGAARPPAASRLEQATEQRGSRRSRSALRRPSRSTRGRARRPPKRGPTRSAPPASRQAIEPPPAPTVWMSSAGSETGRPAITRSAVSGTRPSSIRQTSQEVPPMSKQATFASPAAAATSSAPPTPPAGPDRTVRAACAPARATSVRPPLDCMIWGSGSAAARRLATASPGRSRAAGRAPRRAPSWRSARTRGTCRRARCDSETARPGGSSASSSPISRSCEGSR